MAKKDIKEYYDLVCQDYHDMLEALRDMEKEAMEGLISPQQLEQTKESIEPVKNNYMTWSYVMYLLNKPSKFELLLNKIGIKTKSKQYSERVDINKLEKEKKNNKEKALNKIKK